MTYRQHQFQLIHSIDPFLKGAITVYGDSEMGKQIIQWSKLTDNPDQLNPNERDRLYTWLKAGLDRGLVAEYRAWTLTFQIYQDGLVEGLWKPISWIDDILSLKQENERLENFIYDFLDKNFVDPSELHESEEVQNKIFLLPLVKNAIMKIRQEYRTSKPTLIPLEKH